MKNDFATCLTNKVSSKFDISDDLMEFMRQTLPSDQFLIHLKVILNMVRRIIDERLIVKYNYEISKLVDPSFCYSLHLSFYLIMMFFKMAKLKYNYCDMLTTHITAEVPSI